jgi:23S rRNA (cytidine1920-2'-O)/16S rRNA (cytidine1409-2'-O)-methyltransferase
MRKVLEEHPELDDPMEAIRKGEVMVGASIITNPRALVTTGVSVALRRPAPLRGTVKLRYALGAFGVHALGKVALDLGASAGGFTTALLEAGARRVYAVDAGHGVLRGSLRLDARVVNLERTNLASLSTELVPDRVEILSMDLSYLAVAKALPELTRLRFGARAELVALVKPMHELGLAQPPSDELTLTQAVQAASLAAGDCGWEIEASIRSSVTGARGAVEFFLHGRWSR